MQLDLTDRLIHAAPIEAMRGKNVLIVGINYWPELTGIAPYTTATAEHLASRGAAVEVFTGLPSYPSWQVAEAYRRGRNFREWQAGVNIRRLKHAVPAKQDALRRGAYEATFLLNALRSRPQRKPDVVVGITPALSGAAAAARIARRTGAPLVLVVQDLLGAAATQSGISGGSKVATAVSRLEAMTLRQADAVAVVTDAFRASLASYGVDLGRVHTVRNWVRVRPAVTDRAGVRERLGWPADVRIALHTGNMGLKQDLGNVIEAARSTSHRGDLRWVLMGDGSQRAALMEQARGVDNVSFLPLCDEADYPDLLAAADVLVLNERPGVAEMSLPSKLTGYFMSGRPIAACVTLDGSTAQELARAGAPAPAPAGDPAGLVALVDKLCADPDAGTSYGLAAQRWAQESLTANAALESMELLLALVTGSA